MKKILFFILVAAGVSCSNLSLADAKKTIGGDSENFELIISQSDVFVDNLHQVLVDYNDEIDRLLPQADQWLLENERKFRELDYLFVLNEINIFRQGFIYKQINDLFQTLEKKIISFNSNIKDTYDVLKMIEELKVRLKQTPYDHPKDIKKKAGVLEKLIDTENVMKKRLVKLEMGHSKYLDVYKRIDKRVEGLQKELNNDYRDLLFVREPSVIDLFFWKFMFVPVANVWVDNMSRTLYMQVPTQAYEWGLLALVVIFLAVPFFFLIRRYCRKKYGESFKDHPLAKKFLHRALIFGLVNMTIVVFNWGISPKEYQFIEIVRLSFNALFFIHFSWALKSYITNKALPVPFMPLFWLFFAGLLMRLTAADFGVVAVLFPVICLFCILGLFIKSKLAYPRFERMAIISSIAALSLMFICSIIGFCYLALFISFVWMVFCSILQVGIAVTLFYERSVKTQIQFHSLGGMLLISIAVPLLWIFLMIRFVFFLSNFFYMGHLLTRYIDYQVKLYGMAISLMDIFIAMIVFVLFRGIIMTVKYFYRFVKEDATDFQNSIVTVANYLVWGIYGLVVLKLLDVNYTSILVVLGGMSVGIGFGLQHIVNNFFSGLILLFGKDLRPGDTVEIDGMWAYVLKVNFRSTVIKTYDNAIVTLSNATVLDKDFRNWTLNSPVVRRDIKVGVAYGSDVQKVKKLLIEVAGNNEHVMKKPIPTVLFSDFGDSALQFILRFWIDDIERNFITQSELREEIDRLFRENDITIAFPQMDVHFDSTSAIKNVSK